MTAPKDKRAADDDALWARAMRDTAPLKKGNRGRGAAGDEKNAAKRAVPAEQKKPASTPAAKSTRPTVSAPAPGPGLPPLGVGAAPGVDKRSAERLRRGLYTVEARLDLHRHTQEEAHRALQSFVSGQANAGRRCVRVVTGKGSFREGGGVLKSAVPRWLNESPLREQVLAFSHARRDDGGEGALYVLLRRRRPKLGPTG